MLLTLGGLLLMGAVLMMPVLAGPPDAGREVPDTVRFFGRLHPVLLHLPIGILMLAGLFELGGIFSKSRIGAGPGMLFFGAASAVVAAILGFLLWQGSAGDYKEELVERHLWGGIAVASLAILAFILKLWTSGKSPWPVRVTVFAAIGVLTFSSHDGGTLTHGEGYLTQYAPAWLGGSAPNDKKGTAGAAAAVARPPEEQIVYADVIVPILEQKCYGCHNAEKKKGKFRMDEYELLVRGGDEGEGMVPGDAEKSAIVERISLPLEDDDHMPPDGKKQIEAHELVLIKWWLDQGGLPTTKLADMATTPEVELALSKRVTPAQLAAEKAQQEAAEKRQHSARTAISGKVEGLQKDFPGAISFEAQNSSSVVFSAVSMRSAFANEHLAKLGPVIPAMVSLDLSGTKVDDAGLRGLESASQLRMLRLSETGVTDAGLDIVAKMNTLESLNLYGTAITDAGLDKLGSLGKLKHLYLWQTKVTDAAVAALQKKLPGCEIVRGL
jgi:uncharacterized membrane protein